MKIWEVNYLGLFNYKERNQLYFYYKFLRSSLFKDIQGDVVESGVFRGKSLITAALMFKKFKIKKKFGDMILLVGSQKFQIKII